ncbi:CDP-glycerol glycerophosphotransferase family protein [Aeromicrobium sp.]|uniref:CDP-glycerol glycerophosphotransferase family protein n=1 Tax=Aeromicrobium sp. TaxID=1871063 RepID=UPI0028AB31A7|nr:CDP-glycerol glycerophosphotransferase family protein [Aeromicrobium sp.]
MSSRSTPGAAPKRKAAAVIATDSRGDVDDQGRVVLSGTATGGQVVDAVSFKVRGKGGPEVVVPAAGTADFSVVAPIPEAVPAETFSLDVRLHLRDPQGVETVRRLNAGPEEQFVRTSEVVGFHGRPAWWYATRDGELSLRVGMPRDPRLTLEDTQVRGLAHGFAFSTTLTTVGADIGTLALQVTVRATDFVTRLPVEVSRTERDPVSQDETHHVSGTVDLAALVRAGLPADEQAMDVALVAEAPDGTPLRRGLSLADDLAALDRLAPITATEGGLTQVLVPGVTFKSQNLTFAREVFTEDAYRYLTRLRRLGPLWSLIRLFSRVWVIGETPYKAQDAGFHLFRWIRQHRPRVRAHYVISADSPERAAVEPLGQVVTLRSREHIRASFLARRFATSHKVEFVLATTDRRATRWMRGNRVFLQHGVLGTKNMVDTYGRLSPAFHTDFFHVSSERERELVVNDLRYRRRQVRVTGLSRFDRLLEPADAPAGLLVIPTWRDWLLRAGDFEDSEFLERWRAFLASATLRDAIAAGMPVTVILHPNMRFFGSALDAEGVTVLQQGDVDVQTLLRTHAAMVTDYSSVGFDFSFRGRPVFYHQFDREQFLGKRPSHLDLDSDLPGDVFLDADDLAQAVVTSWRAGFGQHPEHARRSALFLSPAEGSYCEQVFESVRTARSWWVPLWRLRDSERGRRTYERFRAGGLYEPAMKALSWIGRLLPRRELAVFESNVGRAAADSPRAIYDELVARDSDLDVVWSTRDTFRPRDLRTRKVEPGSPAFHWALARARYWVNNQNFGPPLTRPRGTTYVQTWHGTPLKRMQFDAVSTTGRKEGYLDRVAAKTATWSTLVSPSPYATEAFRSAFRYDGPVLEVGYPRNDVLVTQAQARADLTRRRLGLPAGARVVLYAPTFRDDVRKGNQFGWDGVLDWATLVDGLSPDTVVLVRRHSVVRGSLKIPPELAHRVRDVSAYGDTQDLLCLADVLVTDYSSVMFDYALLDRPLVLFCYDLEHYRDELRGFYLDLEAEAPGALARTQEQLREGLLAAESGDPGHADARRRFRERFAPLDDGRAAARVVDEVFGR